MLPEMQTVDNGTAIYHRGGEMDHKFGATLDMSSVDSITHPALKESIGSESAYF